MRGVSMRRYGPDGLDFQRSMFIGGKTKTYCGPTAFAALSTERVMAH
jgi:hypothetical protein